MLVSSTDCSDDAEGQAHQTDERGAQRDEGAQALRLGAVLQGQDLGDPERGARDAAQVRVPVRVRHVHVDLRAVPGESSTLPLVVVSSEEK